MGEKICQQVYLWKSLRYTGHVFAGQTLSVFPYRLTQEKKFQFFAIVYGKNEKVNVNLDDVSRRK